MPETLTELAAVQSFLHVLRNGAEEEIAAVLIVLEDLSQYIDIRGKKLTN